MDKRWKERLVSPMGQLKDFSIDDYDEIMEKNGFVPMRAYTDGVQVLLMGTPPNEENITEKDLQSGNHHNCDLMGCLSVGPHILDILITDNVVISQYFEKNFSKNEYT